MTNASHDPRCECEQVLYIAAACGSSDDAQAQTPAGNKAASVSAFHHQQKDSMRLGMLPTQHVQQYKLNAVQAQQPNAMPHLTQCAIT